MYDLDRDGVTDHVGMFDAWRDANGRELRAIEGVSSAEGENGGEVMLRNGTSTRCWPSCTCAPRSTRSGEPPDASGPA